MKTLFLSFSFFAISLLSFGQFKPVLGESWKITGLPNLPIEPGRTNVDVVDHSFYKRADGKWVVIAAIRGAVPSHPLYSWVANKLTDTNWAQLGVVAAADSAYGEDTEKGLYAPHILKKPDGYYCFYTTASSMRVLFSKDGFDFKRKKDKDGRYQIIDQLVGRDVMVFEDGGKYYAYSTVSTFDAGGWPSGYVVATFAKFQDDFMYWPHPEYTIVNEGGVGGNGAVSCESPFVLKYEGDYYLFRASSKTFKTYVYRSKNLLDFGVNNDSKLIAILPLKAAEVIEENGKWFISDLDDFKGLRMHRFEWVKDSLVKSKGKSKN